MHAAEIRRMAYILFLLTLEKKSEKSKAISSSFECQTENKTKTYLKFFLECAVVSTLGFYLVSILRKSISGRHRPVRVADGPMTARCRFT